MKKTLLMTVGCSGSGKSTYAEKLAYRLNRRYGYRVVVLEADDYFINKAGEYNWDSKKLHAAHLDCQHRTDRQMRSGCDLVIVSNTNTTGKERKPYIELAKKWDYRVVLRHIGNTDAASIETYAGRNVHRVPKETILKQAERINNGKQK